MEKETKQKLDTLAQLLQQLQISNAEDNKTINTAQSIVNDLISTNDQNPQKAKSQTRRPKRGDKPKIGDRVTIVNPKGNQPREGTVIGFTKAGYVKIRGETGHIIRRIPINIIIQTQDGGRKSG
jgi:hypothetical protein